MLRQVMEIHELLDDARISGDEVASLLRTRGLEWVRVTCVEAERGKTDFIRVTIPGSSGKSAGGRAATLGLIGQLGGLGSRPDRLGLVSDADGAIVVLSCALKLADMIQRGDRLAGDLIVTTHICPSAPTREHDPVPFMASVVEAPARNSYLVDAQMDAILSVDSTKGNRIVNHRGFALTPTVKEAYILRVSEALLDIMEWCTGRACQVMPITVQDITPYGNGLFHINSILQPSIATDAPVVGVAITAQSVVPGCATGTNAEVLLEEAARFCMEVAKAFGRGQCPFFDSREFARLTRLYGSLRRIQETQEARDLDS